MRVALLSILVALGHCMAERVRTTRAQIQPSDYGLTEEEWARCGAHFGPAGNPPTFEAEWCAKNKDVINRDARQAQEKRQRAEQNARDQEAKERLRQSALEERRRSPEVRFIALSAKLCRYAQWRAIVLDDVKREQRYAAEVGSINLARLEQDKTILRDIDDAATRWRKPFVDGGVEPAPCTNGMVAKLTPCMYADAGGGFRTRWSYYPTESAACADNTLKPYLAEVGQ
jgi:hypothetical protein